MEHKTQNKTKNMYPVSLNLNFESNAKQLVDLQVRLAALKAIGGTPNVYAGTPNGSGYIYCAIYEVENTIVEVLKADIKRLAYTGKKPVKIKVNEIIDVIL